MTLEQSLAEARVEAVALDARDPLGFLRDRFVFPQTDGVEENYLVGNSLGLMSSDARSAVEAELDRWGALGVRGHFTEPDAWWQSHDAVSELMAPIVGAFPQEVTTMNSLTINLHLLMVSFYEPTAARHKILIDDHAFPSDHFAVESQIRQRGFDPGTSLVTVGPREGQHLIDNSDIVAAIDRHGPELALVMWPGVQYYTGQVFDLERIAGAANAVGARVGFDLAHAVGNIPLSLHDWDVDFAAWCTYKYLNGGPGSTAGAFINDRHFTNDELHRFLGWWGTKPETRFEMATTFESADGANGWQVSCGSVLSQATLIPQLRLIEEAGGITALRTKAEALIGFLDRLLEQRFGGRIRQLNPRPMNERGCQFALEVIARAADGTPVDGRAIFEALERDGIACDWRHPDVIRVAPVPLYTRFVDVVDFVDALDRLMSEAGAPASS